MALEDFKLKREAKEEADANAKRAQEELLAKEQKEKNDFIDSCALFYRLNLLPALVKAEGDLAGEFTINSAPELKMYAEYLEGYFKLFPIFTGTSVKSILFNVHFRFKNKTLQISPSVTRLDNKSVSFNLPEFQGPMQEVDKLNIESLIEKTIEAIFLK